MHPFVALMRTYCIDYTNSHDQSLYDEIMEPDYVVHINGLDLVRSSSYSRAVTALFDVAPGLGLVVHELVLNGDRLCMHFSEHGAFPGADGPVLACWRGIGLYKWNGERLTENYVEQDYLSMQAQLAAGPPHPLTPPHLDPWVTTQPVAADPAAEAVVRSWLSRGDLADVDRLEADDGRTGAPYAPILDVQEVTVNDLFSAGTTVPFHVTQHGTYRGGLGPEHDGHVGEAATLNVVGIARVEAKRVTQVDAVTTRMLAADGLAGTRSMARGEPLVPRVGPDHAQGGHEALGSRGQGRGGPPDG